MKVFIDTNVLVSAALKDKAPEAVILFVVGHPDFEWKIVHPMILSVSLFKKRVCDVWS